MKVDKLTELIKIRQGFNSFVNVLLRCFILNGMLGAPKFAALILVRRLNNIESVGSFEVVFRVRPELHFVFLVIDLETTVLFEKGVHLRLRVEVKRAHRVL